VKSQAGAGAVIVLAMWGLKRHYAAADPDALGWILCPTAWLAGTATGTTFVAAAGEGYLSRERLFMIEKACAGINFLIAALGMTGLVLLHRAVSWRAAAAVVAASALASYAAAVVVNATRIAVAMWLADHPMAAFRMSASAIHRLEGIAVYFCGLLLLYRLVRRLDGGAPPHRYWPLAPLAWYYLITLGIPLANGARGAAFVSHAIVVSVVPLIIVSFADFVIWRGEANRN
jgi:exosortase K